jgi:hypothetical protein
MPGLQYMFTGRTLVQAYSEILGERGTDAEWYARDDALAPWERGNTINGTTAHRFARLIGEQKWRIALQPRLAIGSVGRRAVGGKGKIAARLFGPLTRVPVLREAAVHRIYLCSHEAPRFAARR